MHATPLSLFLASLTFSSWPLTARAQNSTDFVVFNSPNLMPFIHVDLLVGFPVNSTTLCGDTATVANRGGMPFRLLSSIIHVSSSPDADNQAGNVTGSINATIVPVGAAFEVLVPETNNTISFYTNTFHLNVTSSSEILLVSTHATVQYANNALHGFGNIGFSTRSEEYLYTNFASYVGEFSADFNTGEAVIDVFELESAGRVDGQPIPALLPPGEA